MDLDSISSCASDMSSLDSSLFNSSSRSRLQQPEFAPNGRERVVIVGATEWGTALARTIGAAASENASKFEDTVRLWVPDERVGDQRLCDLINDRCENVKYLPGLKLPINVLAEKSIRRAVSGASLVVFALPQLQILRIIPHLKRSLHPGARVLCVVDGLQLDARRKPSLTAKAVGAALDNARVSVLVAADILPAFVHGRPCEMVLGVPDEEMGELWASLLRSERLHVHVSLSAEATELSSYLAPIIALAAGFCDGIGVSGNSKAAIVRQGIAEARRACALMLGVPEQKVGLASSCLANVVSQSYGGHTATCAQRFALEGRNARWEVVELQLLAGCRTPGLLALQKLIKWVRAARATEQFPLIVRVHEIALLRRPAQHILPLAGHERAWRRERRVRIAAALMSGIGKLACACLVGVGVFLLERDLMGRALRVDKLGEAARRTVSLASYVAAIGCVHSCLRWTSFGLAPTYGRSLALLALLLTAGLAAASAAGEFAREVHGLHPLHGWLVIVPAALVLAFSPLAVAYSNKHVADFLLSR